MSGRSSRDPSPTVTADSTAGPELEFDVAAPRSPPTSQRRQAIQLDAVIARPSIARANLAVSTANPHGSVDYPNLKAPDLRDNTVLQQHVLFWDRDGDGAIYPWDTYKGFRELGFGIPFSLLSVFVVNAGLSYPTRLAHSYVPDPWFRVYVTSIHKAKHGSDSGTFDNEGRFCPQMFENMFSKWDTDGDGTLSAGQLLNMIAGHRLAVDPFGWFAGVFEFGSTWLLVQKDGRVSKEDLRQTYDGSIFWRIRDARLHGKGWHKGFGLRDLVKLATSTIATAAMPNAPKHYLQAT
ncbi:Caleosin related protein-domain-containing protein [Lasiosphaeria miniovina]|uniref:Caleosin related protein-domain-containing protein n=1 Tax=Lasiosphaeria miniovina TaxID=1954250 RepID=A0AA40DS54_9PEZI|nr:Caleosin related protein-domain-containing protein [Lasiosphaeria miniovina]KAK0714184.1 Caleosin related protein-domain-containing protein [Lasiosphaeria miniovina]